MTTDRTPTNLEACEVTTPYHPLADIYTRPLKFPDITDPYRELPPPIPTPAPDLRNPAPFLRSPEFKHDTNKPRLELVPPDIIRAIGYVRTHGARKYGTRGWDNVEPERYIGAILRHLTAYMSGEEKDADSGLPHMWHIATNVAFLISLELKPDSYEKADKALKEDEDGSVCNE